MELIQIIILSLIQGITEYLPISSSAHLILVPMLTHWPDQGLEIDVAAHIGSLVAITFYLRKDIFRILCAGINSTIQRKVNNPESRLFWYLAIASIPVLLAGFLLKDIVSTYLRNPLIIAGASIGFGLLLWFADVTAKHIKQIEQLNVRDVIIIGLAQALALLPGTSRSGITMTAGLMLGLDRISAARFSFLMSVPVIVAAGAYESLKVWQMGEGIAVTNFLVTAIFSAVSAFLAIHLFLKFLNRVGMLPFVIYRVVLGVVLIVMFV